jgi:MFS family permease
MSDPISQNIKQGLRENWGQFLLLVIINGFVGGMVGLERTILPEIAEADFGLAARTAILSFIVVFGIAKAFSNYYAGALANKTGRKKLLIIGWIVGLPVPLILMYAPDWNWIIFANILLGVNQGLAWSSTVVMKIDLVGEKNRGLAMGLNESAGYLAVGGAAFFTGYIASNFGLRPYPFYLGVGFAITGLLLSVFLLKDTHHHVKKESVNSVIPILKNVFKDTTWRNPNLSSVSQAGLINNLNDAMVWGLFPILLASKDFNLTEISKIVAVYPMVWGISQLLTGKLADHLNKKSLLTGGMIVQGIAILLFTQANTFWSFVLLSIFLGIGTALVYPTFLASISENSHPNQRAESIGVFRLWRDLGYAAGAILVGFLADFYSIKAAILVIGLLTMLSGLVIAIRMRTKPSI